MESVEVRGKTVEEAIQRALYELGRRRDEVEIIVLSEGSRGILGIGAEDARILVTPLAPPVSEQARAGTSSATAEIAADLLAELLEHMGINAQVHVRTIEPDREGGEEVVALDVDGDDLGILIGRHGDTLAALQLILSLMVNRRTKRWPRLVVDVAGYRQRREASLRQLALQVAEQAWRTRRSIVLRPMPPSERRLIHLALQHHPHVTTHSIGDGEERRVVVSPKLPSHRTR
ncbi:MAG TPA: RNA-binding cell elongation regulator Jag/EloR [Chloroflexota bacterium]